MCSTVSQLLIVSAVWCWAGSLQWVYQSHFCVVEPVQLSFSPPTIYLSLQGALKTYKSSFLFYTKSAAPPCKVLWHRIFTLCSWMCCSDWKQCHPYVECQTRGISGIRAMFQHNVSVSSAISILHHYDKHCCHLSPWTEAALWIAFSSLPWLNHHFK